MSFATPSFDAGLAKKLGLISTGQNRVLLTTVAMSMAATPFVAQLGDTIAKTSASPVADNSTADLDRFRDAVLNVPTSADDEFAQDLARRVKMKDVVVVLGYGAIGKVVCEMLDAKLTRYVVLEKDALKAEQARSAPIPHAKPTRENHKNARAIQEAWRRWRTEGPLRTERLVLEMLWRSTGGSRATTATAT